MDHPTDPGDARALMRDISCRHPGFFEAVLAHRLAMALSRVAIGDPVVMHPGIYIVQGQVVLDGIVEVHGGAVISPWVLPPDRSDGVWNVGY